MWFLCNFRHPQHEEIVEWALQFAFTGIQVKPTSKTQTLLVQQGGSPEVSSGGDAANRTVMRLTVPLLRTVLSAVGTPI